MMQQWCDRLAAGFLGPPRFIIPKSSVQGH